MPKFLYRNLALAAAMYQCLEQHQVHLQLQSIEQIWPQLALGQAAAPFTLYGRSQRLAMPSHKGVIPLVLDVCHNVDGAKAFLEGLSGQGLGKTMPVLVSVLKDKETDQILDVLRSQLQPVILFGIEHERGWSPNILASRHHDLAFFSSFEDVWTEFVKNWQPADGPVAICGSVLVVGQVLQYFAAAPQDGVSLERILRGDW
jgi:dihydrofolate synthase/folylpolyglutamate synthase